MSCLLTGKELIYNLPRQHSARWGCFLRSIKWRSPAVLPWLNSWLSSRSLASWRCSLGALADYYTAGWTVEPWSAMLTRSRRCWKTVVWQWVKVQPGWLVRARSRSNCHPANTSPSRAKTVNGSLSRGSKRRPSASRPRRFRTPHGSSLRAVHSMTGACLPWEIPAKSSEDFPRARYPLYPSKTR